MVIAIILLSLFLVFFAYLAWYWYGEFRFVEVRLKRMTQLAQLYLDSWTDLVEGDSSEEVVARYEAKRKEIMA